MLRPMAKKSLLKPAAAKSVSSTKAAALCREWQQLEEDRLELQKCAAAKRKQQDGLEAELALFVDAHKSGRARQANAGKFRVSIVQVAKGIYYKGELIKTLGETKVQKLLDDAGTKDRVEINPA